MDHVLDVQANTVVSPRLLVHEGVSWMISASGFWVSQTVDATPETKTRV